MHDAFQIEEKENFAVPMIETLNNDSKMYPIYS